MCEVRASSLSQCIVRDTSTYAVHRRAFARFSELYREMRQLPAWLRNATGELMFVDTWIPATFDNLYALPVPIAQATRRHQFHEFVHKSQHFRHACSYDAAVGNASGTV